MAKFLFESTEIERQRILNLHNTYRKKILFEKELEVILNFRHNVWVQCFHMENMNLKM
jgi:hypothetical protein